MAKVQYTAGRWNQPTTATNYHVINGNGSSTVQLDVNCYVGVSGTFSNLSTQMIQNERSTTFVVRFCKNGSNGSQVISIPGFATGNYTDTTNTDSVVSGDLVSYSTGQTYTSGTVILSNISTLFDSAEHTYIYGNELGGTSAAYASLSGEFAANASLSLQRINFDCVFSHLSHYIGTNTNTSSRDTHLIKESSNPLSPSTSNVLTITVPAETSGRFTNTGSYSGTPGWYGYNFSDSPYGDGLSVQVKSNKQIFSVTARNAQNITDITRYTGLVEILSNYNADENIRYTRFIHPYTLKELAVRVHSNTTNTATFRLRKNQANANQVVSVSSGATGTFVDTTNTDMVLPDDKLGFSIVKGNTNTLTIADLQVTTESPVDYRGFEISGISGETDNNYRSFETRGADTDNSSRSLEVRGTADDNNSRSFEIVTQAPGPNFQLEYKLNTDVSWTKVPEAADHTSEAFIMKASTNISDNEATTRQLSTPSGKDVSDFLAGKAVDVSNPVEPINLEATDFTEVEWSIEATADAVGGETYEFRVTDNGTPVNGYLETPEITIQGTFDVDDLRSFEIRGLAIVNNSSAFEVRGSETVNAVRALEIPSDDELANERDFEVRGTAGDNNSRGIEVTGSVEVNSSKALEIKGADIQNNDRDLEIRGTADTNNTRAFEVRGKNTDNNSTSLEIRGVNTEFNIRDFQAIGSDSSESSRGFEIQTFGIPESSRSFEVVTDEAVYNKNLPKYLNLGAYMHPLGYNSISSWSELGRPTDPPIGTYGLNFDTDQIEIWNGSEWLVWYDLSA